ncbi:hypothetical protein GCM10012275_10640 [Longimycelium tulufanense]|uniref:Uncharacterized protein n=1 Tax=Longimycelium tulufanense TaxID=907463 RepID=A0A8J3FSR6_9PSEU|nr:hypothetical protein GCM10012275_10640 [Longimycelium tulufanense]
MLLQGVDSSIGGAGSPAPPAVVAVVGVLRVLAPPPLWLCRDGVLERGCTP